MDFKVYSGGKRAEAFLGLAGFEEERPGVFESLRTYRGKVFHEEAHLRRLMESARTCGCPDGLTLRALRRELRAALAADGRKDVFIRLTFFPAMPAGRKKDGRLFVMIGTRNHAAKIFKRGVALKTSPVRRPASQTSAPEAKTHAYQGAVLAGPVPAADAEWLFLDRFGYVGEVRTGNVFIVSGSALVTPPARGILNGVTRRFVLKCAEKIGMKTEERPFTRHDVFNADEAFLTNTSWEILPVRELDGRRIAARIPGRYTAKLHRIFQKNLLEEIP